MLERRSNRWLTSEFMRACAHSHARGAVANLFDHAVVHDGAALCQRSHQANVATCAAAAVVHLYVYIDYKKQRYRP